jgi:heme-degrading monooxygenase HmoA
MQEGKFEDSPKAFGEHDRMFRECPGFKKMSLTRGSRTKGNAPYDTD